MAKFNIWLVYPTIGTRENKCLPHSNFAMLKIFACKSDAIRFAVEESKKSWFKWTMERYQDDSFWHGTSCAWMDNVSQEYWVIYQNGKEITNNSR